jgi:DNA-binding CsgD family transcriptional regulator
MSGAGDAAAGAAGRDNVPLLLKAAATAPSATAVELYDAVLVLLADDDPVAAEVRAARARTLTTMGRADEATLTVEAIAPDLGGLPARLRLHVTEVLARLAAGADPDPVPDLAAWRTSLGVGIDSGSEDGDEVRAVLEYALVQLITGHVTGAAASLAAVDSTLDPAGDEVAEILAGTLRATTAMYDGRLAEAAQIAEEVHDRVRRTAHAGVVAGYLPLVGCGVVLARAGRHDRGLELLAAGRQMVHAYGLTWSEPLGDANTAAVLLDAGRWDDALATVDAGLTAVSERGQLAHLPWLHSIRALVLTRRGELDGAATALAEALEGHAVLFNGLDHRCWAAANLAAAHGDTAAELTAYDELVAHVDAAGLERLPALMGLDATRAHLRAGDRGRAAELARRLPHDPATPLVAAVERAAGGLLADDEAAIADAAHVAGPIVPHLAARLWEDAAVVARTKGAASADAIRRAVDGYHALGATTDLARLQRSLPDVAPAEPSADAADGIASLTPTERRIVRLVVEGRSNPEIAEELAVSRRTVESHLRRVFTKVGVRSRLQLAVAAREHDATG